ncbi:hypothetical protein LEMLEM_LOCUS9127 [Lemmus lemmus]
MEPNSLLDPGDSYDSVAPARLGCLAQSQGQIPFLLQQPSSVQGQKLLPTGSWARPYRGPDIFRQSGNRTLHPE